MNEDNGQQELPSLSLVLAMPVSLIVSVLALTFGLLIALGLDEGSATGLTPTATETSDTTAGAAVFTSAGCGGCHTLSVAGSTGTVGPNLDETRLSTAEIVSVVTNGRVTGMPAFSGRLSEDEIASVAALIAAASDTS